MAMIYKCRYLPTGNFLKLRCLCSVPSISLSRKDLSNNETKNETTTSSNENNFIDTTQFKQDEIPKQALYLGFGGAIPFVSLALASGVVCAEYANYVGLAQMSYGACILTFLGGVHWGKELMLNSTSPDLKTLTWSVMPSLFAWSAFSMPYHFGLYYLASGLVGAAVYDLNDKTLPKWYRNLRVPLSILASTSIAVTGYNLHPL